MVGVLLMPPGALISYIALRAFVWRRRRRMQNQVIRAAITTTPPIAPPTIAPVLDFEDEEGEVPVSPLGVGNAAAVTVACALVAVDSGASKSHTVGRWLRYHNEHTSSKLSEGYIESIGYLLWFEH